MSRMAVEALKHNGGYLQSPVDDIELFLWVMVYAIVWNSGGGRLNDRLLRDYYSDDRDLALLRLDPFKSMELHYRPLTRDFSRSEFFPEYDRKVSRLAAVWRADCASLKAESKDSQIWTLCYAAAAVGGLHVILQVAVDFLSANN